MFEINFILDKYAKCSPFSLIRVESKACFLIFLYKKSAAKALLRRTCNRMLICYQTALKLISNPLTEWVSAPTEMKSTPHSA